jgi:hypothetical protein
MTEIRRHSDGFLMPIDPEKLANLPTWERELLADTTRLLTYEELTSLSRTSRALLTEQENAAKALAVERLKEQFFQTPLRVTLDMLKSQVQGKAMFWSRQM